MEQSKIIDTLETYQRSKIYAYHVKNKNIAQSKITDDR